MDLNENKKWETIPCPVCDNTSFTNLFEKRGEPFVRCNNCSLVLINPRPAHKQILETYNNDYSRNYAIKVDTKLRRSAKRVALVKKSFGSSGRWLDIGCSAGFVVKAASQAGFEAFGVDVESWGINYGKTNLGLENLSTGLLEEQTYPDAFFDVISLYDVIEHVPDLNILVKELKRILAPNGVIDIITPDIGHFLVTSPLSDWKEIKPSEHLYYFDKKTINKLFHKHRLSITKKRFGLKPSMKICIQHTK
jgi:2-polyprenyl-3-methyl-5-hydroxy-6-metoxy-1,4-benzoquinol methylase